MSMVRGFWRGTQGLALLGAGLAVAGVGACGGDDLGCGGPFCISPAPPEATTLTAGQGDGQTGAPGRQLPLPLEAFVTDADNRPVQDVLVTFQVRDGGGTLSSSEARSDVEGRVRVSWTLGANPGTHTVQATALDGSEGDHLDGSPIAFSAQAVRPPPATVVIVQTPSAAARNGVPFETQPVIAVLDVDGEPVPEIPVVASIASGGGSLGGTTTVSSDASGQVAYADLAILGSSGPRTLRFSVADPALEATSGAIELTAGSPSSIEASGPTTFEATVNSPVSPPPAVIVRDDAGNGVPGVAVTYTANRSASVSPSTVISDEQGIAQVTSWTLGSGASGRYTLTARVEATALPAVSFTARARAGAAGQLRIATPPSSPVQSGVPLPTQPVIQVVDQNGNPTPQPNIRVEASVASGPRGSVANATATTDASGRATFSGLTLSGVVGNYTLSFSASNLAGAHSGPITLEAGPAARLNLTTSPSANGRSRVPLAVQPTIQIQDRSGNPVTQGGLTVTATIGSGEGSLDNASAATDGSGAATFSGLTITGSPGTKVLSFAATGLESTSAEVTLPAVAEIVVETSSPASAVVASAITGAPSWILRDQTGQPVPDAPVTLAASTGGSVAPTSATSDPNGRIQVQTWTLGTVAGDQYVEIGAAGISNRAPITAVPDAPARLQKISGDDPVQSAPPNSSLPELLVVRVVDQYDNGVAGVTVQWRACDGTGNFDPATDQGGYSGSTQPTGPEPGTYCSQASASRTDGSPLDGSPVQFTYTVTEPQEPSPSPSIGQLRSGPGSVRGDGVPPGRPNATIRRRPAGR